MIDKNNSNNSNFFNNRPHGSRRSLSSNNDISRGALPSGVKPETNLRFVEIGRTLSRPVVENEVFTIFWELRNENAFDWNKNNIKLI